MGDFYCTKCGKVIQPSLGHRDKDGVIQGSVSKCHHCGSTDIRYDSS